MTWPFVKLGNLTGQRRNWIALTSRCASSSRRSAVTTADMTTAQRLPLPARRQAPTYPAAARKDEHGQFRRLRRVLSLTSGTGLVSGLAAGETIRPVPLSTQHWGVQGTGRHVSPHQVPSGFRFSCRQELDR